MPKTRRIRRHFKYCLGLVTVAGFEGRRGERCNQECSIRDRKGTPRISHPDIPGTNIPVPQSICIRQEEQKCYFQAHHSGLMEENYLKNSYNNGLAIKDNQETVT